MRYQHPPPPPPPPPVYVPDTTPRHHPSTPAYDNPTSPVYVPPPDPNTTSGVSAGTPVRLDGLDALLSAVEAEGGGGYSPTRARYDE
jgi:hypothetical protein